MLPKTMSESLIKKLNEACKTFSQACGKECDDVGWCEACWIFVGSNDEDGEMKLDHQWEEEVE